MITHHDVLKYFKSCGWETCYHELLAYIYKKSNIRDYERSYSNTTPENMRSSASNQRASTGDAGAVVNIF